MGSLKCTFINNTCKAVSGLLFTERDWETKVKEDEVELEIEVVEEELEAMVDDDLLLWLSMMMEQTMKTAMRATITVEKTGGMEEEEVENLTTTDSHQLLKEQDIRKREDYLQLNQQQR